MKYRLAYILLFILLSSCHPSFHYLPAGPEDLHVTHYAEFSLSYNANHRQANWVAYELTAEELKKEIVRKNYFAEDRNFGVRSARLADYEYSGYDRGHLCRAEYCKSDERAYRESFLLSNMSPQIGAGFNRAGGAWYKLEELEVKLASHYGKLYSVSGPIFQDQLGTIGENKITIPGYFFKAFLLPDYKAAVGFIVRHEITSRDEFAFAVTIDSLESFTHIDFYPALSDDVEDAVESTIDLAYWAEPNEKPDLQKNKQTCRAITKSGARCKRMVNDSDYCWQHRE